MAGLAYFRHLGLVFLILQSATLYSRQRSRPARQLRYLTSSAILPDGDEDVRLFRIRNMSTSSAEHSRARSTQELKVFRRKQRRSFLFRTSEGAITRVRCMELE